MRIVHVVDGMPPLVVGGAGRIALDLACAAMERGHDSAMLTAAEPGALPRSVRGVPCHAVTPVSPLLSHYRSVFDRSRAAEIATALLGLRPDVVHAHTVSWHLGYGWMPIVADAGVPVVFTAHDAMTVAYGKVNGDEQHPVLRDVRRAGVAWNPLRNFFIRKDLGRCAVRIAVSDALASYLRGRGIAIDRTVHNGVDTDFWIPSDRAQARVTLGIEPDACAFLLAGRLGYDKGVAAALAALPKGATLLLAGEAYGQGAGDARVRALGPLDAEGMRLAYAACDTVLAPSVYLDPFPTVCLEAMACGRAVIATLHGGAKEAVRDGRDGWILDPRDEVALRDRLRWCMERRGDLDSFGASGRSRVLGEFSLAAFAQTMLGIYTTIAGV